MNMLRMYCQRIYKTKDKTVYSGYHPADLCKRRNNEKTSHRTIDTLCQQQGQATKMIHQDRQSTINPLSSQARESQSDVRSEISSIHNTIIEQKISGKFASTKRIPEQLGALDDEEESELDISKQQKGETLATTNVIVIV